MQPTVVHEPRRHRFVIAQDGAEAFLSYAIPGDALIELRHTYVPPALSHRGLGDALANVAFAYVREHGLKAIVTCQFLTRWMQSHPEVSDLVVPAPGEGAKQ